MIAVQASPATLKRFRFSKIDAEIVREASGRGRVQLTAKASLQYGKGGPAADVICEVLTELLGFPAESPDATLPAFRITLTAQGSYSFAEPVATSSLKNIEMIEYLARPLHLSIVVEMHAILRRMDIQGIRLPPEITIENSDSSEVELAPSTLTKPIRKRKTKLINAT